MKKISPLPEKHAIRPGQSLELLKELHILTRDGQMNQSVAETVDSDAIPAMLELEAHGYQVNVTELVGWEHSMKNELIIAVYKDLPRRRPMERLNEVLETLGLEELGRRFSVVEKNSCCFAFLYVSLAIFVQLLYLLFQDTHVHQQ